MTAPLSFAVGKAHFYDLPEVTSVVVIWSGHFILVLGGCIMPASTVIIRR